MLFRQVRCSWHQMGTIVIFNYMETLHTGPKDKLDGISILGPKWDDSRHPIILPTVLCYLKVN